jgi:hypothetical protein
MRASDERRDDERDEAPPWNTPEIEAAPGDGGDELPLAARRVLATDRHLSQRGVFYGHAGSGEDAAQPTDEDETAQ